MDTQIWERDLSTGSNWRQDLYEVTKEENRVKGKESLDENLEEFLEFAAHRKMSLQRRKIQITRRKIKTVLCHECQGKKDNVSGRSKCSTKSVAAKRSGKMIYWYQGKNYFGDIKYQGGHVGSMEDVVCFNGRVLSMFKKLKGSFPLSRDMEYLVANQCFCKEHSEKPDRLQKSSFWRHQRGAKTTRTRGAKTPESKGISDVSYLLQLFCPGCICWF